MMTDEELNMLMQSLSDEEIGGLYASLPADDDAEAAGRIADRFYQKCAAAGMAVGHSVRQTVKPRPRIPLKYMGFAAAACVAAAAGAAAFYNAQTEKPGVIIQPASSSTAAVTEITLSQPTTTGNDAVSADTTDKTTYTTTATTDAVSAGTETVQSAVSTESGAESTVQNTQTVPSETLAVSVTAGTAFTAGTSGTVTTMVSSNAGVKPASTTAATTTIYSSPAIYTSMTRTIPTDPPIMTPHHAYSSTSDTIAAATSELHHSTEQMELTGDPTYATTTVASCDDRDFAAAWLVHAPYCNTYQRGEWYDLTGTVLGVEYVDSSQNELEKNNYAVLTDNPDMFSIDDSEYDADHAGTYPIHIIYDRGAALGSRHPAKPAVVSIYVTVL